MKTVTILFAVLMSLAVLSGCATRGEVELREAHPDAYDATRGGHSPGGDSGGGDGGDSDGGEAE